MPTATKFDPSGLPILTIVISLFTVIALTRMRHSWRILQKPEELFVIKLVAIGEILVGVIFLLIFFVAISIVARHLFNF
jgi:hypothetical protein